MKSEEPVFNPYWQILAFVLDFVIIGILVHKYFGVDKPNSDVVHILDDVGGCKIMICNFLDICSLVHKHDIEKDDKND